MTDTTVTIPRRKGGKRKIDYPLAATMLAAGMTYRQVAERFDVTPESAKVGCVRKGITKELILRRKAIAERAENVALQAMSQASETLKRTLAGTLQKHAQVLAEIPAKANLRHLRAVGEAIEPIARTGKLVHDWGNTETLGIIVSGDLAPALEPRSIDIETTINESTSCNQKQVSDSVPTDKDKPVS